MNILFFVTFTSLICVHFVTAEILHTFALFSTQDPNKDPNKDRDKDRGIHAIYTKRTIEDSPACSTIAGWTVHAKVDAQKKNIEYSITKSDMILPTTLHT